MNLRRGLSKLPTPVAVAFGFAGFVALGLGLTALVPPARDKRAECESKCRPLPGTLIADKTYPLSAKNQSYPMVCKCGSAP